MKASSLIIGTFFFFSESCDACACVYVCHNLHERARLDVLDATYIQLVNINELLFFFSCVFSFFHMEEEEEGKTKEMEETHTRQTIMVRAQTLFGALLVALSFHLRRFFFFCFTTRTKQ